MAKSVAWDGEGATCLIEVSVSGAETDRDALTVAKSIANSMLTKAAIFGHDPNWGRIAAAAGYAGFNNDASLSVILWQGSLSRLKIWLSSWGVSP